MVKKKVYTVEAVLDNGMKIRTKVCFDNAITPKKALEALKETFKNLSGRKVVKIKVS